MVELDHADMPAHIARQAGVRDRIDIPGAHAIARLELGGRLRGPAVFGTGQDALDLIARELAARRRLGFL